MSRSLGPRLGAAIVAATVLLVACGSTTTSGHGAFQGSMVADGSVDQKQLSQLTSRFTALDRSQQQAQIADLDRSVERQLWTVSGLEQALGGASRAERDFAALNAALAARVAAVVASPTTFTPTAKLAGSSDEALGAGIFGGMLTAASSASGAVTATNDGRTGRSRSRSGVTVTATRRGVRAAFAATTANDGVELRLDTLSDMRPCPDADGNLELTATVGVRTRLKGSSVGNLATVAVDVTGRLGDSAVLEDSSYGYRVTSSRSLGAEGDLLDASLQPGGQLIVNRIGDRVPDKFTSDMVSLAQMVALVLQRQLVDAARSGWQSGRCVRVKTSLSDGPDLLKRGSTVTITTMPVSTVDGAVSGGSITAKLRQGTGSVQPSVGTVFTYHAPDKRNQVGVVAIEVRSRRGVGFTSIRFDTNARPAFRATGSAGDFRGSGTVCDLSKPFTISGSGLTLAFTPSGPQRGRYTLSGTVKGNPWTGGGGYTASVNQNGTAGVLIVHGTYTVESPFGRYGGHTDMTFRLTETEC